MNQKTLSLIFKSSRLQMFFKVDVLKNFVIFAGKHLCWSYFLIKLQAWTSPIVLKRDSNTGVFLWILRNFSEYLFWRTFANGYFCTSNHKVSSEYWAYFLNQKHDVGWFLLSRSVDLVRLYSLLIISSSYSNTFLLLDLQKNKSNLKNRSSDVMILTGLDRLLPTT